MDNDLISRSAIWDALYEADAITMWGAKILSAFPAVDAVEVVRCGDCKYYGCTQVPYGDGIQHFCRLHKGLVIITKDSFCSYGERRPDAPSD